jgi:hypothetical protein
MTNTVFDFLDPKAISVISDYKLLARYIVDGYFSGHHRGPRHAISLDFNKHRDYYPGDPLKMIDWKLYSRTDRFFVKQFEEETNLEMWILIDTSHSMDFTSKSSPLSKLKYATCVAAALAYLAYCQKDSFGLIFFDDRPRKIIPPRSSRQHLDIVLKELQNVRAGNRSDFEQSAKQVAARIKKRGLVLLFTDFLTDPDIVERTLRYFLKQRSELAVFHILTFEELHFPFQRFSFFQDMETKDRVLLQPKLFQKEYVNQIHAYLKTMKRVCGNLKVVYQVQKTSTSFEHALRSFLECRNRIQ